MKHNNTARRILQTTLPTFLITGTLLLAGCAATPASEPAANSRTEVAPLNNELSSFGFADMSSRDIIEELETMAVNDRSKDLSASIQPTELILSKNEQTLSLPLPADQFYLSVAPYVTQTHDCTFHVPTGCQGELGNTEVYVTITDTESGKTYYSEETTTYDNGFIGYWLPQGVKVNVTIEANGKTGSVLVGTGAENSPTCITTLQLKPV
ncbi:hypothetical protein G7066_08805 [Leucobacter coleopterorum]|uniref:Lipoprotein n=1 Tax=Leucobacter coleopterorum TaxID=2714933 RepID=A0ABX6JWK4_9MICO|nr:CueP family metal-binding protein [Leucobacter coleopterorum]QIM18684.1 hypothetical protein G7066_08805 [Leucobacter coleopterorum]